MKMEETSIKMPSHLDNGRFFTLQFHINNCKARLLSYRAELSRAERFIVNKCEGVEKSLDDQIGKLTFNPLLFTHQRGHESSVSSGK